MAAVERETWVAVVQTGDEEHEQETELVTVEYRDGKPSVIDVWNGQRIELLEPASAAAEEEHRARRAA